MGERLICPKCKNALVNWAKTTDQDSEDLLENGLMECSDKKNCGATFKGFPGLNAAWGLNRSGEMLIPKDRQQDLIDIFWVILRQAETHASGSNGNYPSLDRIAVEDGYRIMRDLGITTAKPNWLENKNDKNNKS